MKHGKVGRIALFLIIGLVSYSGFLLANLPADKLWRYLPTRQLPVQLSGISGTPWSGSVENLTLTVSRNPVVLPSVRWQVMPGSLLQGVIEVDVALGNAASPIEGEGRVILSREQYTLENIELDSSAQWLLAATGTRLPGEVTGNVFLQLDAVTLNNNGCVSLQGDAQLTGSQLLSPFGQFDLGNTTARLSCKDRGLFANISQSSSILSSQGDFQLAANGRYTFRGKMTPADSVPDAMQKGFSLLGKPDSSNAYPLQFSGRVN